MVISKHDRTPLEYESPALLELGTVHEVTLIDKDYGATDGMTFQGIAITNASR